MLSQEQMYEIVEDVKKDIANDITIFALTNKKNEKIDIYLLSLKENFLDGVKYMKAEYANREKTPHWRIRFFYPWMEQHLFTLDLWKNALNRWIRWENWKDIMSNTTIRKKVFYSLLDVVEKDLTPFLNIDQNEKNEAIIKIIEKSIKKYTNS